MHQELNANALTIPTPREGGAHGHLALVIPAAQCNAINVVTVPWVRPVHPGATPNHAGANTAAQITEANRACKANLEEFQLFVSTEAALKKPLLAAVPDTHTCLLKDDMLGCANTTTLALLTHLDATHGTITPDDLSANLEEMEALWSPTQPIEDLWNQIKRCQRCAAAHDPISNLMAIRSATTNLTNSGVFTDALKDWRKKTAADQTWANLLTHFNQADTERRRHLTASDAGYAGNVHQLKPKPLGARDMNKPTPPSRLHQPLCGSLLVSQIIAQSKP